MMELVKVNETVNRSFNDGVESEEVTSISYEVVENGSAIGSASISSGYFSVNGAMSGSIEEIRAKVETMFVTE